MGITLIFVLRIINFNVECLFFSDLRQCYESYYKLTGSFCSQARKAVLEDSTEQVGNLKRTGKELSQKRTILLDCCYSSLKPWINIPLAAFKTEQEQIVRFLSL